MLNDCHITYTHNGTPHSITIDGVSYPPDDLRILLWRSVHLRGLMLMALVYGIVVGIAITWILRLL